MVGHLERDIRFRNQYVASIPAYNPNKAKISMFCWPDAITRGKGMGADLSVTGLKKYLQI